MTIDGLLETDYVVCRSMGITGAALGVAKTIDLTAPENGRRPRRGTVFLRKTTGSPAPLPTLLAGFKWRRR
jgi:hypothetical protein